MGSLRRNECLSRLHGRLMFCVASDSAPGRMASPPDAGENGRALRRLGGTRLRWWERVRAACKSFLRKLSPALLCRKACHCYERNMMAWAEEAERRGAILVPELGINASLSRVPSTASCGSGDDYRELIESARQRLSRSSCLPSLDLHERASLRMDRIDENSPSNLCSSMASAQEHLQPIAMAAILHS